MEQKCPYDPEELIQEAAEHGFKHVESGKKKFEKERYGPPIKIENEEMFQDFIREMVTHEETWAYSAHNSRDIFYHDETNAFVSLNYGDGASTCFRSSKSRGREYYQEQIERDKSERAVRGLEQGREETQGGIMTLYPELEKEQLRSVTINKELHGVERDEQNLDSRNSIDREVHEAEQTEKQKGRKVAIEEDIGMGRSEPPQIDHLKEQKNHEHEVLEDDFSREAEEFLQEMEAGRDEKNLSQRQDVTLKERQESSALNLEDQEAIDFLEGMGVERYQRSYESGESEQTQSGVEQEGWDNKKEEYGQEAEDFLDGMDVESGEQDLDHEIGD